MHLPKMDTGVADGFFQSQKGTLTRVQFRQELAGSSKKYQPTPDYDEFVQDYLVPRSRVILASVGLSSHYHCLSRVADRNFVFQEHERDVFRLTLRQVEAFSGVRVLTWTILSNYFHLLLEVPPRPVVALTDAEILDRCRELYSKEAKIAVEWEFAEAQRTSGVVHEKLRARFLKRMFDLSEFMKTLKQKFTKWFNAKHDRVGVLWEARFKSIIVEGRWKSLLKVAAYIDLNSVRAGMAERVAVQCAARRFFEGEGERSAADEGW